MTRAPGLWLAATFVLGGCATEGARVTEYLDPQTAVTIRALATPSIYAHDAPALAANTRDYLSLGVVEANSMGARKHYLVLVSWSTIDRKRVGVGPAPVAERIEVVSGGKTRELALLSHEPRSFGVGSALYRPPSGYVGESWYALTPAELRALAAAPAESIVLVQEPARVEYLAWRLEAAALAEFVRDIPDAVAVEPGRR